MSYRDRIQQIETLILGLDRLIELVDPGKKETGQVNDWKRQRYDYLAELAELRRLQWDEDHERVNFDDER
jgi:hypothetical protein